MIPYNYSIIIPHKNIPLLLQRCIDSIPCRPDIQVIIIDDNSDSSIVNFDNFPGQGNPLIEIVFSKEGKGAGNARNIGLELSKGKWLVFADADDFFNLPFCEALDKYANDEINDIVYFKASSVISESLLQYDRDSHLNYHIEKASFTNNYDYLRYQVYPPFCKFIKRELVVKNNIRFQESFVANDVYFSMMTGYFAKNVSLSYLSIYCVTHREGSLEITASADRYRMYFDSIKITANNIKKYNLQKYLKSSFYFWWKRILKLDKGSAIQLFPDLLKHCGFQYIFNHIIYDFLLSGKNMFPGILLLVKKLKERRDRKNIERSNLVE